MTDLKMVKKLPKNIEEKMRKDLVLYENSHGIDVNYKPFSLILTGNNNELIGVLNAFTAFSEVYIDDLWVDTLHRGKGYGRALVTGLEDHFKGQGFNNINLCTNQFNAPQFYEKCGFTLEFVRKNREHPKLTKFFFIKYFKDEIQTQGIMSKNPPQTIPDR